MSLTIERVELERMRRELPAGHSVDVTQLLVLAEDAWRHERYDEAEKLLQAALVVDPEHAPTYALAGKIEDDLGEVDVAQEAYRRAIHLRPDDVSALALGRLLASIGQWEESSALAAHLLRESEAAEVRQGAAALLTMIEQRTQGGAS